MAPPAAAQAHAHAPATQPPPATHKRVTRASKAAAAAARGGNTAPAAAAQALSAASAQKTTSKRGKAKVSAGAGAGAGAKRAYEGTMLKAERDVVETKADRDDVSGAADTAAAAQAAGSDAQAANDKAAATTSAPTTGKKRWQLLHLLEGHTAGVNDVKFHPDGKRILSASVDKTVRVWDVSTGKEIPQARRLRSIRKHVRLLKNQAAEEESYGTKVQGANGITRRIYASTMAEAYDNTVKLWDRETGKCEAVLQGHRGWVNSAIYSNDGKTIVTGSEDKTVRLWDAEKGTCFRVLKGHFSGVLGVVFSPDNVHIVSASRDKTLRIWKEMPEPPPLPECDYEGVTYLGERTVEEVRAAKKMKMGVHTIDPPAPSPTLNDAQPNAAHAVTLPPPPSMSMLAALGALPALAHPGHLPHHPLQITLPPPPPPPGAGAHIRPFVQRVFVVLRRGEKVADTPEMKDVIRKAMCKAAVTPSAIPKVQANVAIPMNVDAVPDDEILAMALALCASLNEGSA
ncbi:hypothetical protein NFJ02_01g40110 [Pycnococcus provasolii]